MKVDVFVPHDINIYLTWDVQYVSKIRKYVVKENAEPIITLPKSGKVLSVLYEQKTRNAINGIPVTHKVITDIDLIPSDTSVAIVSGLYASATNDPRVYTVMDAVFSQDGKTVVGCLSIGKIVKSE